MIPTKQVRLLPLLYSFLRSLNHLDFFPLLLTKDTILILFYRIWMLSSTYMIRMAMVHSIIKNSHLLFSTKNLQVDHQPREAQVPQTQKISARDLEQSSHLEELEASSDLENHSELWTTITPEVLISTNSPRQ